MNKTPISYAVVSNDTAVIEPGQSLDNDNAHEMVEAITGAQTGGCRFIIIDMKNLEFISSSGVGSILGSIEVAREAGGDVILCNVSRTVGNILNVLDLMEYLTVTTSREEAEKTCVN